MTYWKFDYESGSEELEGDEESFAARYGELQLIHRSITVSRKENESDDYEQFGRFERAS